MSIKVIKIYASIDKFNIKFKILESVYIKISSKSRNKYYLNNFHFQIYII